jgi:tetratricopeptide (TPR) repeat protein
MGHLEEIEEIVERWRAAGPDRLESIWNTADELSVHGFGEAGRSLLEGEVARFDVDSAYLGQGNNRAMVLYRLGRVEEAHALWEENMDQARTDPWATVVVETAELSLPDPGVWSIAEVGYSAALIGDSSQAREMEQRLVAMPEPQHFDTPFLRAKIAAALGEKERDVELLEEWLESPYLLVPPFILLHRDFTLPSLLRGYPPFEELVKPRG